MRLGKTVEVSGLGGPLLNPGAVASGVVSGLQMVVHLLQLKGFLQLAIPRCAALTQGLGPAHDRCTGAAASEGGACRLSASASGGVVA
jgi:hypothetical protein